MSLSTNNAFLSAGDGSPHAFTSFAKENQATKKLSKAFLNLEKTLKKTLAFKRLSSDLSVATKQVKGLTKTASLFDKQLTKVLSSSQKLFASFKAPSKASFKAPSKPSIPASNFANSPCKKKASVLSQNQNNNAKNKKDHVTNQPEKTVNNTEFNITTENQFSFEFETNFTAKFNKTINQLTQSLTVSINQYQTFINNLAELELSIENTISLYSSYENCINSVMSHFQFLNSCVEELNFSESLNASITMIFSSSEALSLYIDSLSLHIQELAVYLKLLSQSLTDAVQKIDDLLQGFMALDLSIKSSIDIHAEYQQSINTTIENLKSFDERLKESGNLQCCCNGGGGQETKEESLMDKLIYAKDAFEVFALGGKGLKYAYKKINNTQSGGALFNWIKNSRVGQAVKGGIEFGRNVFTRADSKLLQGTTSILARNGGIMGLLRIVGFTAARFTPWTIPPTLAWLAYKNPETTAKLAKGFFDHTPIGLATNGALFAFKNIKGLFDNSQKDDDSISEQDKFIEPRFSNSEINRPELYHSKLDNAKLDSAKLINPQLNNLNITIPKIELSRDFLSLMHNRVELPQHIKNNELNQLDVLNKTPTIPDAKRIASEILAIPIPNVSFDANPPLLAPLSQPQVNNQNVSINVHPAPGMNEELLAQKIQQFVKDTLPQSSRPNTAYQDIYA